MISKPDPKFAIAEASSLIRQPISICGSVLAKSWRILRRMGVLRKCFETLALTLMHAHHRVMTGIAYKPGFRAVVCPTMVMIDDARRERKSRTKGRAIEVTREIDPLAALRGPRLAAKRHRDRRREQRLFQRG